MRIIRSFYSNRVSYSPATLSYYNRVVADGGTVADLGYVEECITLANSLNGINGTWISPYFGNKIVNGKVVKAYSILSADWVAPDNSDVTIVNNNGFYYSINEAAGLNTDEVNYFTKEFTYISKSSTQDTNVTVFFEYSPDKNHNPGFLISFESNYWCNTISIGSSSLSGILSDVVLDNLSTKMIVATGNLNKTIRESNIFVEGVENVYPYVSPYGNLDSDLSNSSFTANKLFMGSRGNQQYFTDIKTSGVLVINKELNKNTISLLTEIINKKYLTNNSVTDTDCLSYFESIGNLNAIEKYAINNFVVQLKTLNLWDKFLAIYPVVGSTEMSHSYNLKNTNSYRIDYFNNPIHTRTGVQWDGQTQYGNTNCSFNDTGTNDYGMSYYSRSDNTASLVSDTVDMGMYNSQDDAVLICTNNNNSGKSFARTPQNSLYAISGTIASGLFAVDRYTNGNSAFYKFAEILTTGTNSINYAVNLSVYLGNLNLQGSPYSNGYSNREFCYADIGRSLSASERLLHYHLVQQLQFTLSRQI